MGRVWRRIGGVFVWAGRGLRRVLDTEIGFERKEDPVATLYHRPLPPRLGINWWALVFGPFWYLARGMWVHASILLTIAFLSGGILIPFVWLYAGLKADEDLLDARIMRKSYY